MEIKEKRIIEVLSSPYPIFIFGILGTGLYLFTENVIFLSLGVSFVLGSVIIGITLKRMHLISKKTKKIK